MVFFLTANGLDCNFNRNIIDTNYVVIIKIEYKQ